MIEKVSKKTTITKIIRNAIKKWVSNYGLAIVKIIVCIYFAISILGDMLLLFGKFGWIEIEQYFPAILCYIGTALFAIYISFVLFEQCYKFYAWAQWRTHFPLRKEELPKLHIHTKEDLLIFLDAYSIIKNPFTKGVYVFSYYKNKKADYYLKLFHLLLELPSYDAHPYNSIYTLSYSGKIDMITKELAEDIRQYYKSLECNDLVGFIDGLIKIERPELFIEERRKMMEERYANNN